MSEQGPVGPPPEDDGAADHLPGRPLPPLRLPSTDGRTVILGRLGPGRAVLYLYPMTRRPGADLPEGWATIPGAMGCTPEACGFRDHHAELLAAGADAVFGLSSQDTDYQREVVERLHLPFPMLADPGLTLAAALGLPTFQAGGMTLYKRLTMVVTDGVIERVFYPVHPPDQHATQVLGWLRSPRPAGSAGLPSPAFHPAGPMRILLVSGGTRAGSTNTAALRTAEAVAPAGVATELYDRLAELPAFNPDLDAEPLPLLVAELRARIDAADAALFCAPEYAGTLPGSFKNLLDWTVGGGEMYRKPVAWLTVASAERGLGAEQTLATVLGYLGTRVIEPACVRLPVSGAAVGPDGTVTDPEFRTGVAEALRTIRNWLVEHRADAD